MSKDLKGKELGVGICQRKDGLYTARFISKRTGKSVQRYLGHANVGITMNLYVHVTEDEKVKEVERIESALKIV